MRFLKSILLLFLVLFPIAGMAQEDVPQQEKYTETLRQKNSSGASVEVNQDDELDDLVNGGSNASVNGQKKPDGGVPSFAKKPTGIPMKNGGPHSKTNGFRVQIYMAGNTANDKAVVKSYAKRFKSNFPSVNAYVYFNSPHWVCAVGDFQTKQEADLMLKRVRPTFRTAYVVRATINSFK